MHRKLIVASIAVLVSLVVAMGSLAQAPPTRPTAPLQPAAPAGPALSPAEEQAISKELADKTAPLQKSFADRLKVHDAEMKAKVEALNRETLNKAKAVEAKAQEKIATWRHGFQGKKLGELNPTELEASRKALESEIKRMQDVLSSEHSEKIKGLEGDFIRKAAELDQELKAAVDRLYADFKNRYPKLQNIVPTQ